MVSKNKASNSRSSSAGSKKDKHGTNKNGKKGDGPSGSSFFMWFMIIALLGVWSSVAVVWFDLVDYEEVLAKAKEFRYNFSEVLQGKLGIYDADGDGDFDVEDAKILLGMKKVERSIRAEHFGKNEEPVQTSDNPPLKTETQPEEPEPIKATMGQESFKTNTEPEPVEEEPEPVEEEPEPVEEEPESESLEEKLAPEPVEEEPEPVEEEPKSESLEEKLAPEPVEEEPEAEETNEFDAVSEDSVGPEAEESVYMEDEAISEIEETMESEEREGEVNEYTVSDEAVFEPEEVVSEQDATAYESETEDFSDHLDSEGEREEDLPISDEFIEGNDPELEDKVDEFYAEEVEHVPGTDDIQALPVQKSDEDYLSVNTSQNLDVESEIQDAVPLSEAVEEHVEKDDDTPEAPKEHLAEEEHVNYSEDHQEVSESLESDHLETTGEAKEETIIDEPEKRSDSEVKKEEKVPAKKKKPKLLNKFDKTIKPELDAAEKLRKKGKPEEALQAFNELLKAYPQSPRAKYGKAQSEDDLAEKMRSNEILQRAISTYGEVADMPNPTADLVKLALKRQANRQQFLGHIKRSVMTLKKLVSLYPDDISIRNELGVSYLLLGDNNNAKKVYEEVLAMAPNDGFAKVHYGFILKAANQIAESIPYLKEGLLSGDPGTDDGRFYFHLGDALQRVGDQEAHAWYELGHKRGHFASVWQRSLYNVNGLKAQPWWTAKETGYTELVKTLERNWKLIREEGLTVMDKERGLFLPEDENLREKGDWGQFTIWQQGRRIENSCQQVPKTCALLERFPETTGCKRGQIKYSVMQPGTHVWPHTGPTNCRLRMHLGLVIPKEGCRIRCANDTREWKEGKVLIFDDSFEHEVWQDAASYRLIFIVDVWHPDLTAHQRRTLSPI
ncbi:aspartyl/asparaginyl beta-hydroxylase isoform X2 [Hypanus sabinus]|uniref:aspartyl/asparaginyl beta-hydroxylase isoform X2 n=1 Tax=Hypanus sabinus TaxID=79690 RepID=UPI0028C3AE8A|nr:aspartyl/asparaginyl beta-hydroxylase isoform X2 [Hypanus sabinus]